MPDFIQARFSHLWFLIRESAWVWMVGTAWLGIGMFLVIRSRFFPVAWQQQTTIPIVSEISLPWWIGVFICLIFVAILEGSFRTNAEMIVRIAELESRFMNRDQRREIRMRSVIFWFRDRG